jgi:hypothetical protein
MRWIIYCAFRIQPVKLKIRSSVLYIWHLFFRGVATRSVFGKKIYESNTNTNNSPPAIQVLERIQPLLKYKVQVFGNFVVAA